MPKELTRRELMRRTGAGALCTALGGLARGAEPPSPPNFVFINIDDLAWDAIGFMGRYPFLRTPHIDRLAREGAVFHNAFVTISLCSPSRACSLTGCHAHRHGVRVNERYDPHPDLPTYPETLREAGYTTAHIGKWHMRPDASPRPGFDYWLSFRGQGKYIDPELNENGRDFQAKGYMTDLLTDYAVRWLEAREPGQPFCLNLWHKAVHGPFTPAPRHADALEDALMPEPESYTLDLSDRPEWLRRAMAYGARRKQWQASADRPVPDRLEPAAWNPRSTAHLDYMRAILAVDDSVGRVLDALERTGRLENTAVIFTSDNGFFLGEHRRGDKRLAYEESIRIPLLVRLPGVARPGARIEKMALNIDVAPTLLDLAGAEIPETMQGRSLAPLLRDTGADWRDSFLYEYFQEDWLPGLPDMLAVRTEDWKYITYPGTPGTMEELYHLEKDRHELRNLAADPAYTDRLAAMRAELQRLKRETEFGKPLPPRVHTPFAQVFQFNFAGEHGEALRDHTGNGYEMYFPAEAFERTAQGILLNGEGHGTFTPAPNPAMKAFTLQARVVPGAASGAIVSLGGQTHGFALGLAHGRPTFALRAANAYATVAAEEPVVPGQPVHLAAQLTDAGRMRLYAGGECGAEASAPGFIPVQPNEGMAIGADAHSPVFESAMPIWRGTLCALRLDWGAPPEPPFNT